MTDGKPTFAGLSQRPPTPNEIANASSATSDSNPIQDIITGNNGESTRTEQYHGRRNNSGLARPTDDPPV